MSKDTPLATALRVLREARSLTQKELAERSGIERNTISKYENGWITPSREKLRSLLTALGFSYGDLEHAEGFVARLRAGEGGAGGGVPSALSPSGRRGVRRLSEELGRNFGLLIEEILAGGRADEDKDGGGDR